MPRRIGTVLLIAAAMVAGGLLVLAAVTTNPNDLIVWVGMAALAAIGGLAAYYILANV